MSLYPPRYQSKHCFVYCGPERCNCINGNRDKIPDCKTCNGTGRIGVTPQDILGTTWCQDCNGTGCDGY